MVKQHLDDHIGAELETSRVYTSIMCPYDCASTVVPRCPFLEGVPEEDVERPGALIGLCASYVYV